MKISYNAPAMRASNALNASDNRVSKSLERLSSGLKVTTSKDNPSGYAIGTKMHMQITGITTATQSSQNGISVIETADGALTEVHEMLQRMNELAVKGETGTLTTGDRMTLEQEVKQLKAEITRISTDTQFNGQTLLDGTFDLRGYTDNHKVRVDYYSDEVMAKEYTINQLNVIYDAKGNIVKDAVTINLGPEFPQGVEVSDTGKSKITLKGPLDFEMTLQLSKENMYPGFEVPYDFVDDGTNWVPKVNEDAVKANFTEVLQNAGITGVPADAEVMSITPDNVNGTDTIVVGNAAGFRLTYVCDRPKTTVPNTDPQPGQENGTAYGGLMGGAIQNLKIDITGIGTMDTQTGANEGQQLAIRIPTISLNRMDMEDMKMKTSEDCADANRTIKKAILYVSDARSRLGAYQNRLEHTVNNLAVTNENMTASYSRIMDVDMAEEMTAYTTEQVISQAAVSMLAQANERPSQVLQLLQ
ncbi:MAG: flagellin [Lachnospiraceae bacterium]|nr:flagellin [Lachnospiraceae bacterium]